MDLYENRTKIAFGKLEHDGKVIFAQVRGVMM